MVGHAYAGEWYNTAVWALVFLLMFICMYAEHRTRMVILERDHYKKMVDMYQSKITVTHKEWEDMMIKVGDHRNELLKKQRTERAKEFVRERYPDIAAKMDQGHLDLNDFLPKYTEEELNEVWMQLTGKPKPTDPTDKG